jgi:chaperonin GroEL (HSP60 family)
LSIGSTPDSSQDFSGVVMTKNVIHKRMRSAILNARILIFDCPLENDEYKISCDHQGNQEIRRVFKFLEFMDTEEKE